MSALVNIDNQKTKHAYDKVQKHPTTFTQQVDDIKMSEVDVEYRELMKMRRLRQ